MENNKIKKYLSVAELAKMLGVSRVAVFKRIKKGQIFAEKIGRSYFIPAADAEGIVSGAAPKELTQEQKEIVKRAVEKVVKEYGETLRLLGKE